MLETMFPNRGKNMTRFMKIFLENHDVSRVVDYSIDCHFARAMLVHQMVLDLYTVHNDTKIYKMSPRKSRASV